MDLQHIAPGLVQPSQNDNVVAGRETVKSLCHQRTHFQPCVGRPLRTLFGRFAAFLDAGSDHTNRTKLGTFDALFACSHLASSSSLLGLHQKSPPQLSGFRGPPNRVGSSRERSAITSTMTIFPCSFVRRSTVDSRPRGAHTSPTAPSTGIGRTDLARGVSALEYRTV